MTPQELTIGQAVEILYGEHQGLIGQIIEHEWDEENGVWYYFVGIRSKKFGPYTRDQLS